VALVWSSVVVLVVPPLSCLVWQVGLHYGRPPSGGEIVRQWTAGRAAHVMFSGAVEFADEIRWTLLIGALTAATALVMAVTLLLRITRRSGPLLAPLAWWLLLLSLVLPGPLIGLLLIRALNVPQVPWLAELYDRSLLGPVLASLIRCWPVVAVLVWFARRGIAQEVGDLSELEGAGRWLRLRRILLPLSARALLVAGLAAVAISAGELAATILVLPPGMSTVATRVFGLIHSGVKEKEAAICLWHVLICLIVTVLVTRAGSGWLPRSRRS
jgi:iron(III) transport system permease protein